MYTSDMLYKHNKNILQTLRWLPASSYCLPYPSRNDTCVFGGSTVSTALPRCLKCGQVGKVLPKSDLSFANINGAACKIDSHNICLILLPSCFLVQLYCILLLIFMDGVQIIVDKGPKMPLSTTVASIVYSKDSYCRAVSPVPCFNTSLISPRGAGSIVTRRP